MKILLIAPLAADRTEVAGALSAPGHDVSILQSTVEFSLQMPGHAALFAVTCGIALHKAPARREFRPSSLEGQVAGARI